MEYFHDAYAGDEMDLMMQNGRSWNISRGEHSITTLDSLQPNCSGPCSEIRQDAYQNPNSNEYPFKVDYWPLRTNLAQEQGFPDLNNLSAASSHSTAETSLLPFTPRDSGPCPFPSIDQHHSVQHNRARSQSALQVASMSPFPRPGATSQAAQARHSHSSSLSVPTAPRGLAVSGAGVDWHPTMPRPEPMTTTDEQSSFETPRVLGQPFMAQQSNMLYPSMLSPSAPLDSNTPRVKSEDTPQSQTPNFVAQLQTPVRRFSDQVRAHPISTSSSPAFSYTSSHTPSLSFLSTPHTALSYTGTPRSNFSSPNNASPGHRRTYSHGRALRSPTYAPLRHAPYHLDAAQHHRRSTGNAMTLPSRLKPRMQHSLSDTFVQQMPSSNLSLSPMPMMDNSSSFSSVNKDSIDPAPNLRAQSQSYPPVSFASSQQSSVQTPHLISTPNPMSQSYPSLSLQTSVIDQSTQQQYWAPSPWLQIPHSSCPDLTSYNTQQQMELQGTLDNAFSAATSAFNITATPTFPDLPILPPSPTFDEDQHQDQITSNQPHSHRFSPASPPPIDFLPPNPPVMPTPPKFPGDIYTPKYKRRAPHDPKAYEGWCGLCQPGRWLNMKNSRYWEDAWRNHGICARTKRGFDEPVEFRETGGAGAGIKVMEGKCGECLEWVGLDTERKRWTGWWVHAYKCHAYVKGTGKGEDYAYLAQGQNRGGDDALMT